MSLFWIGVAAGVLLTVPLAIWAMRRNARRLHLLATRARAAERLAEQGMLTGGLAHEIKNPLSSVNLNIQLLQEDLRELAAETAAAQPAASPSHASPIGAAPSSAAQAPTAHAGREKIGRIQRRLDALARETQRLRDILDDFLRFAGRVKLDRGPVDINVLLDELADFFGPQAQASGVRLRIQPAIGDSTLEADLSLLKQALLNLLINATQAMAEARQAQTPSGGCDELLVRAHRARALGQDEIHIHVTDTGPGIPADQLDKIFQPYFSTKKAGTGLGLPTARRIIEEHGGTLSIHSEPGKGSDFHITLPATTPAE